MCLNIKPCCPVQTSTCSELQWEEFQHLVGNVTDFCSMFGNDNCRNITISTDSFSQYAFSTHAVVPTRWEACDLAVSCSHVCHPWVWINHSLKSTCFLILLLFFCLFICLLFKVFRSIITYVCDLTIAQAQICTHHGKKTAPTHSVCG